MIRNLKIVKVNTEYCDYLRTFDSKVPYNAGIKELRPFIGVLFKIDKLEYFAPLSSPKEKHKTLKNTLDIYKIDNGKLGIINFNNMIPITKDNYTQIFFNKKTDNKEENLRLFLLQNQYRFLIKDIKTLLNKSKVLYNLYKENKLPKNVKDRCCNFMLLEEKSKEYKKDKVKI